MVKVMVKIMYFHLSPYSHMHRNVVLTTLRWLKCDSFHSMFSPFQPYYHKVESPISQTQRQRKRGALILNGAILFHQLPKGRTCFLPPFLYETFFFFRF